MLEKLEDLVFADDLVLLSQKITHGRRLRYSKSKLTELKVNASKTKEIRIRAPSNAGCIMCRGKGLEQVTVLT